MVGTEAGQVIGGKYRLVEKLSEGGGGFVWKVREIIPSLTAGKNGVEEREIALKILKWSPLRGKELTTDRFKREFEVFKKLSHPNIAKIYDFGFDAEEDLYYFTSELFLGSDLRKMIGAPIRVIEHLLLCALRALEYLRNFGILHLDIKPQNLMLRLAHSHKGGVETLPDLALIDFGLATFQAPDKVVGTPNYIPPEIAIKRLRPDSVSMSGDMPVPDHRSDLYSLGVAFYYILCGVQPFLATTADGRLDAEATIRQHLNQDRPPPPSHHNPQVPSYLDSIIMRLMAFRQDDRYEAAILAAQALCFRSPNRLEPETRETISAYLPEQGTLIGRREERKTLEGAIEDVSKGTFKNIPIMCIAGGWGTGKTRLLESLKPFAQQHEMEVVSNLRYRGLDLNHPTVFLLDDPLASPSAVELSSFSDVFALKHLARYIQQLPNARCLLVFTLNTDLCRAEDLFHILEMDPSSCTLMTLHNFTTAEVNEYATHLLGEKPSFEIVDELHHATFGNPKFIADIFKLMMEKGQLFSYLSGRPHPEILSSINFRISHATTPASLSEHFLELIEKLPSGAQLFTKRMACWQRAVSVDEVEGIGKKDTTDGDLTVLLASGLIRRAPGDGRFVFTNPLASRIIEASLDRNERAAIHDAISEVIASKAKQSKSVPFPFQPKADPPLAETGEGGGDPSFELDLHRTFGSDPKSQRDAAPKLAIEALKKLHPSETADLLGLVFDHLPQDEWEVRSEILVRMGQALARMGRWDEAKTAFERLHTLISHCEPFNDAQGKLREAIPIPSPLVLARRSLGKGGGEGGGEGDQYSQFELHLRADEQLGLLALRRRMLSEAREIFTKALNAMRRSTLVTHENLENPAHVVRLLRLENYLAAVDLREGKYDAAAKTYAHTAGIVAQLPPEYGAQITNNELGETMLLSGNPKEAIGILERELEWARQKDHRERMVNRLRLLGDAHRRLGDFASARKYYEDALESSRKYYLFEHQLRIRNGLANLLLQMGNWAEAIEQYKPALDLAMQLEGKATAVDVIANIGFAYAKLAQFDDAIEYLELALDFAKGPDAESSAQVRRTIPSIHITLGHAHYEKKEYDEALKHLNIAVEYDKKNPSISKILSPLMGEKTIPSPLMGEGEGEGGGEPLSDLMRYNLYGTLAEVQLACGHADKAKDYLPTLYMLAEQLPEAQQHLKELKDQIEAKLGSKAPSL